jgi:hypothetical protein
VIVPDLKQRLPQRRKCSRTQRWPRNLTMIHTVPLATAAFFATLAMAGNHLAAQDILISEVRADGLERWIELHNRSANPVNIGTWSLHYATHTAGHPQNYWWPLPLGTTLGADEYLRVHWYQNAPGSVGAGEFYTGTSPYGFLFGLGGETLHGEAGALGLIASQQNELMNSASAVRDWVSWGEHGFQREFLAIQAGYWDDNRHCPAVPAGESLARNTASVGTTTTRDQEWFLDPTPTPGSANISGVAVSSYGQACTVQGHHLLGTPQLRVSSLPLIGNTQFGYLLDNTTGVFGECMLLAFSFAQAPSGLPSLLPPVPGATCRESIDTRFVLTTYVMSTHVVSTAVPMSLASVSPAMSGLELHAQAMVFDWLPNAWPPYQGLSNALRIVIGQ